MFNRIFCSLPATVAQLTSIPSPEPTSVREPSEVLITVRGSTIFPTCMDATSAPAKPTEITCAGLTSRITASVARRAASAPIPPHTKAASPFSKRRYRRPPCSIVLNLQPWISGHTSRSSAAMMAIFFSDITVRAKPLYRPPQGAIDRNRSPSQFPLCFGRSHKHHFASHAHGVNRRARLPAQKPPGHRLVHHPGREREHIGQFQRGRFQTRDRAQPVQNLLQRKILAAQNIALARSSLFERLHMTAGALGRIHQVQTRFHVRREFSLQEIHHDPPGRS